MSILIKGVEMPKDRRLLVVVHPNGTVEAHEVNQYQSGWQTLQNAAIPIPPDGRLIIERDVPDFWWLKIPHTTEGE